ncbi:ATP-binding cassette domain-containing protein [Maritimibacter sp. UBA3975]|uniref:ATP-binding cassette domain-containing protein n=1 Tax=Maritimibacter sp. UBA3975 TaxID=1946833 RepID=UPI000C0A250B|nr:ATP-binding cassette domain-containing protein [Maritimibacter sp. UBA3975]MAM61773.1 ABC transporter ATP-binding protein [Maritimibacter sp.]|tara:strand:- start:7638 stop:8378 length:741 start_codon:yes stop_codon:yes gene_type:complete
MSVLEMTAVEKSYGNVKALDGVDLALGKSRFVGLLGPNGAGKSTLFQIISGLFVPDAGTVKLFGMTHGADGPAIRRRMGVVFQARSVDLDMTIRANLRFHGRLFGLGGRKLDARIDALAEQFDLTDLVKRPVRNLSGGQQRKVEIARALINDPDFLIMDEPSAGLDTPSRRALVADIRRLAAEQDVAILWATHLVDEVDDADDVVMLVKGKVVADGAPATLIKDAGAEDLTDAYAKLTGGATPERE